MRLTRRDALALGLGATAASFLPYRAMAAVDEAIAEFTGGAEPETKGLTLTAPKTIGTGDIVKISVSAPGAVSIIVLAPENPTPTVAVFNFGPLAGSQAAVTRIRLTATQDIIAIAKMTDGHFVRVSSTVKVAIDGFGG